MAGLKLAKAKFVVLMDADLSHHPKFIPEFYRLRLDDKCMLADTESGSWSFAVCIAVGVQEAEGEGLRRGVGDSIRTRGRGRF